ncbi:hypothetical protein KAZ92_01140 [Candidatus Gracilibacteria bacterium]|jgi:hypothetical protein|nr:hypothetical protein [Candidatus Gracilibacteria bacterium]
MSKLSLVVQYPKTDDLLKRFSFVDNKILQENVAIAVQHISFLVSLDAEYELGGAIQNSAYKNIIMLSASVAEGLINWKLHKIIEAHPEMRENCCISKPSYLEVKQICLDESRVEIWAVKKGKQVIPLDSQTDFIKLITYAKKVNLFDNDLESKANELRVARNKVHLASLAEVDDKYTKKQIDNCFGIMANIIQCIEKASH